MTQKRNLSWILCGVLVVLLTAMLLPRLLPSQESRFSRRVEEDFFRVEMKGLNGTLAEAYSLYAGDTIDVQLVHTAGDITVTIGLEGQRAIYEGRNPQVSCFRVNITEDGSYLLSVTGSQARGSVSFQINAG